MGDNDKTTQGQHQIKTKAVDLQQGCTNLKILWPSRVTWIKFMLKAHDNMRHGSKFSRTLVLESGICESLD